MVYARHMMGRKTVVKASDMADHADALKAVKAEIGGRVALCSVPSGRDINALFTINTGGEAA